MFDLILLRFATRSNYGIVWWRRWKERLHAYIICNTVREERIICCQIFCDLFLKSAFQRIFNAMQLILVNWFTRHETDIFLNNHCRECVRAYLSIRDCLSFLHEVMIGNHRTKTFLHEVMLGNHRNKT
jgi:hypothetical protein